MGARRQHIGVLGLSLAAALGASGCGRDKGKSEKSEHPVPVEAARVARQDVPIYREGLGNVVAFRTVTVKTQVDGRLDRVFFREGQRVRRGELLAQIDPRPFQVQLQQAEGALARDRALLANARLNVRRDRVLVARKLIAPQQLDTDLATVGQLEGTVRIDEAAVRSARLNLSYARITSPIDGVTGVRVVDQGNVVHPGDASGIVIVTQLQPIALIFTLPQDDLPAISAQLQRGKLPVQAFSRDGSTLLGAGDLGLIDNQINQSTASLRLKAVLPNQDRRLWPNQFVKVRLFLATQRGALVIPSAALQRGPQGQFVYVIGAGQKVSVRPVQPATRWGGLVVVARGLAQGERVVVEGQARLRPGSRVQPRERPAVSGSAARVEGEALP